MPTNHGDYAMTKSSGFEWWMLVVILSGPVLTAFLVTLPRHLKEQLLEMWLYPIHSKSWFAVVLRFMILAGSVGYIVLRLVTFLGLFQ